MNDSQWIVRGSQCGLLLDVMISGLSLYSAKSTRSGDKRSDPHHQLHN